MALFQASITIWLLFILINGGLLLIANYGLALCAEQAHISCGWANKLVASGVNYTNFPTNIQNFTDPTNTLIANLTDARNITFGNHTGNDDVLDPILDSTDVLLFQSQEILRSVTSICTVCNTLDAVFLAQGFVDVTGPLGVPDGKPDNVAFQGMTFLIVSGLGITNVLFLIYMTTGRSI